MTLYDLGKPVLLAAIQTELERLWALPCAGFNHCALNAGEGPRYGTVRVPRLKVFFRTKRPWSRIATAYYQSNRIVQNVWPSITWGEICDTLAHEVAHLVAYPQDHHGPAWQEAFRQLLLEGYGKHVPGKLDRFGKASAPILADLRIPDHLQTSALVKSAAMVIGPDMSNMVQIQTGKRGRRPYVPAEFSQRVQELVNSGIHWKQALEQVKSEQQAAITLAG